MSMGEFERTFYRRALATSEIHPIVIQPETLSLNIAGVVNNAPGAVATSQISAKTSKARAEIGLGPFAVRLRWTGTPPAGYDPRGVILIPILDTPLKLAVAIGQLGSYLGVGVVVVGIRGESIR